MTHPTPRWHQGAALLGGFVMAMLVLVAAILSVQRNEALNSGFQVARLMAQSFEVFLTQSLNASVLAAGQAVTLDRTLDDQTGLQAELQKILRGAPHLRSVSLLDAQGRVVVSSNAVNSGKAIGLGDFYPPLDANNLVLRLGHPWFGRDFADARPAHASSSADTSLSLIPVLFPLDLHGNRFFWLFALNPDYIVNHMLQQLRPQTGEVEVLRLDGVRLLSTALNLAAGEVVDLAAWPRRPSESDAGQRATVAGNGQAALSAYQTSSLYPFLVMTHVWRAPVLDRWHVLIQTLAGVLLPLLVVTGWLAVVLYRRQIQLAQQQAEAQRLQRINAACVFSNSCEGIMITDAHGSIVDVNDAFCDITGYRRDEVLGRNPRFLSSGRHDAAFYAQFWQQLRSQGHWSGILWNRRKDGEVYAEQLTISAVQDQSGQAQQYVGMFTNITAQVQYQNKLERAAHHDALTGLPNRVMLADRL